MYAILYTIKFFHLTEGKVAMEIHNKLIKPITEVKYLTAENFERYRIIIRYFFEEYENIKYWLYKEDIYQMMQETGRFVDYTIEKCQADLQSLTDWGNLTALQDTTKVATIEQYRNKRYRYQLTEYTVEIERMILKLENLEIEGASLEPTLLERLYQQLLAFPAILNEDAQKVSSWWRGIDNDFVRLNRNYQDYVRTLNSHKAEEMMRSEQFLIFKDQLVEYLRTFVRSLQEYGGLIANHLEQNQSEDDGALLLNKIIQEELRTPRLDRPINEGELRKILSRRWENLNNWFAGSSDSNELNRMYDMTNDIIRKITRYAQQIGSLRHRNSNRKEEYRHLATIFNQCHDLSEAHKLSASVFGVSHMFHLMNLNPRETDAIDSGVFDEQPTKINIEIKSRMARNKTVRNKFEDVESQQRLARLVIEERQRKEQEILKSYIVDKKVEFANLPKIDSYTRKIMLSWVSKALATKKKRAKTDFGQYYTLDITQINESCLIECVDGTFKMPKLTILFD